MDIGQQKQQCTTVVISSAGERAKVGVDMSSVGDDVDTFDTDQSHRKSKKTVSVEEWGMGCRSDNNRRHIGRCCEGRKRAVRRLADGSYYFDILFNYYDKIDCYQFTNLRPSSILYWLLKRLLNYPKIVFRYRFVSCLLFLCLLIDNTVKGDFIAPNCQVQKCAQTFTRDTNIERAVFGSNVVNCVLLTNYAECLNRTSRACRGNLRFHSLQTMVINSKRDFNCSKLIEDHHKSSVDATSNGGDPLLKSSAPEATTGSIAGRCTFPYHHQKGASGYRYCGAFGDPHLRTFEGQYETCKTMGAWPLVDNAYINVQLMNEALVDDVNASVITKISVIIKAVPGCTEQKTYTATKDSLPSAFDDGTVNNGNIDVASYRYHYESPLSSSTGSRGGGGAAPGLFLQTLKYDQHVELHLRYVATRVVVRRAATPGGHLSVAVKMPEDALSHESSFSTWQLCMAGCPATEKINYKEILAYPDYYLKRPATTRDDAVEQCRRANVTDFFFDSCVFDLLTTGDRSFVETARTALDDIRHMYPPYARHYETNRSDLRLYDELARLARDKASGDDEYRQRHNNNRRYSATNSANFRTNPLMNYWLFFLILPFWLR